MIQIKSFFYLVIALTINSALLHSVAAVHKDLLTQLLNHSISESIPLKVADLESALAESADARESVDNDQQSLLYLLLQHAQSQNILLTDAGIGTALINGSQSVAKEVATLLLNHATTNSITLLASDIESALQLAAQEWNHLTEDQLAVVYFLLDHAQKQGVALSESGLGLALKEASITLQVDIIRLILQHAEQEGIDLSTESVHNALLEIVKERNATNTKQGEALYLILNYAKNVAGIDLGEDDPDDMTLTRLGSILIEASKKYTTPPIS